MSGRDEGASETVENVLEACNDSSTGVPSDFNNLVASPHVLVLGKLIIVLILTVRTIHSDIVIPVPDQMRLDVLPLVLEKSSLFNPSDDLPTFKFDGQVTSVDGFG